MLRVFQSPLASAWANSASRLDVQLIKCNRVIIQRASRVPYSSSSVSFAIPTNSTPLSSSEKDQDYWRHVPSWKDIAREDFLDHRWQVANTVQGKDKLQLFLHAVLPEHLPESSTTPANLQHIITRSQFVAEVLSAISLAPMSIRLTPHILSLMSWTGSNTLTDPLRRQFIPLKSSLLSDHPKLQLDSLGETHDSPVHGLVHRYHDKALFLATSVCPVYCRFCTRSYAIGAPTESVSKSSRFMPTRRRWDAMLNYIESTPHLQDIVVSGGDSYYLQSDHLMEIGERLLSIPHVRRMRFATKGLCVSPMRILDTSSGDGWTDALVKVVQAGRRMGKAVAVHTHFNHPNEINWVTEQAAQKLFELGVTVRNQTVLLRGINDDIETVGALIRKLADTNIQPYYVYQGDMVRGVEDLRTPLSTILHLEKHIRGTIAGFMTPSFVVDLPSGGGKRLACSYEQYDPKTGLSKFIAPGVKTGEQVYEYWDPEWAVAEARRE